MYLGQKVALIIKWFHQINQEGLSNYDFFSLWQTY